MTRSTDKEKTMKKYTTLKTVEVARARTWSIMEPESGLEIQRVNGKRRKDALIAHLRAFMPATFQALRAEAFAWKRRDWQLAA